MDETRRWMAERTRENDLLHITWVLVGKGIVRTLTQSPVRDREKEDGGVKKAQTKVQNQLTP